MRRGEKWPATRCTKTDRARQREHGNRRRERETGTRRQTDKRIETETEENSGGRTFWMEMNGRGNYEGIPSRRNFD